MREGINEEEKMETMKERRINGCNKGKTEAIIFIVSLSFYCLLNKGEKKRRRP